MGTAAVTASLMVNSAAIATSPNHHRQVRQFQGFTNESERSNAMRQLEQGREANMRYIAEAVAAENAEPPSYSGIIDAGIVILVSVVIGMILTRGALMAINPFEKYPDRGEVEWSFLRKAWTWVTQFRRMRNLMKWGPSMPKTCSSCKMVRRWLGNHDDMEVSALYCRKHKHVLGIFNSCEDYKRGRHGKRKRR